MPLPPNTEKPSHRFAALLHQRKEELVRQWTRRVLDDLHVPHANRLSEPRLRNHIPALIDCLASTVETFASDELAGRTLGASTFCHDHARARISEGYTLTEALSELMHFRAAILDLCIAEAVQLDNGTAKLVHAAIDESMITESDEMERAIVAQMRQEATFRERFLRNLSMLGHDLRNPLHAISLMSAVLLKRNDTTALQARLIHRIAGSAARMSRMIENLLSAARARSPDSAMEPRPAELYDICRLAIEELEIAHPDRTVELDTHGNTSGVWDPGRLAQMVSNLVGNAIDHSPPDTPVRVVLRGAGPTVTLAVNNQGSMIPPQQIERIFDPFFQGSQAGRAARKNGLGLGLFIVKHIVESHGGSIDVVSTLEEGTTFTVRLPRLP